ncbi:MAG: hypothetical protein ACRD0P_05370 [Stackebrandtia sp.]
MQRHSRGIAATALTAMVLPFLAGALGTATAISSIYWAVFLFAVVVAFITWKLLSSGPDED